MTGRAIRSSTPTSIASASPTNSLNLGWEEATEGALTIVEWPERAGDLLSPTGWRSPSISIRRSGPDYRRAILHGHGAWAARLARARAIATLLERAGWSEAKRDLHAGRRLGPGL